MNQQILFDEVEPRWSLSVVCQLSAPEVVTGGKDIHDMLAKRIANQCTEVFYAVFLDTKGGVIKSQEISRGTLGSALVNPREVFATALLLRASSVIVAHNHPSGNPEPSADDRTTTRRLARAGKLLGVMLLDHVVIGHGGRYHSFQEHGTL